MLLTTLYAPSKSYCDDISLTAAATVINFFNLFWVINPQVLVIFINKTQLWGMPNFGLVHGRGQLLLGWKLLWLYITCISRGSEVKDLVQHGTALWHHCHLSFYKGHSFVSSSSSTAKLPLTSVKKLVEINRIQLMAPWASAALQQNSALFKSILIHLLTVYRWYPTKRALPAMLTHGR